MSLTRTVPAAVPSLFHSSAPWVVSRATKKRVPLKSVSDELRKTLTALELPGLMSLTSLVPLLVPSLFHSSTPCLPSLALK